METFGARMSRLRKGKKLKRYDVAEPLGVDVETIARYERDEREPKVGDAAHIARILGVSLEYLATGVVSTFMRSEAAGGDTMVVPVFHSGDSYNLPPSPEAIAKSTEYIIIPRRLVGRSDAGAPPFAAFVRDGSFERFGVRGGSYVVVNPAERVSDFDIAYIFYKGKLAFKRTQHTKDGAVYLSSGDGTASVRVPPEDAADESVFKIVGKAVAYQFDETKKIYHDI